MLKTLLSSYLSHLAGYVISAATIVSTLSPGTFPPKYAFVTAVATAIATAFAHGKAVQANASSIATAVANAVTESVSQLPTPAVSITAANVVKPAVAMFALCLILPLLHGCATVQSWLGTPTGQTVVIAGVQVAVTTAESKDVTAAQINTVAKTVLSADSGSAATLAALTSAVNAAATKAGVPAGDIQAFSTLETAFDAYLVVKYGANSTVTNIQADVAAFCNAVIADTGG
jgi:hypothetical protein